MVESKEDLAKYTIPQLKEKLKHRRLPISGTKADLVSRLHEALTEDSLLGQGLDSNVSATDLDVESLLGAETTPNISTNDELLLLGLSEKKTPVKTTVAAPAPVPTPPAKTEAKSEEPPQEPVPKKERPSITAPEGVEPKAAPSTAASVKAQRAARFGLDTSTTTKKPATDEATDATEAVSEPKNANGKEKKPEIKTSDPKLLARAKRFGLPIGAGDGSAPAKIAKTVPAVEEDEKLKARRIRFGL